MNPGIFSPARVIQAFSSLLGLALFLGLNPAHANSDADATKPEQRPVTAFSELIVNGACQVDWVPGAVAQVTLTGPHDAISKIETIQDGDELRVSNVQNDFHISFFSFSNAAPVLIHLVSPSLSRVEVTGASDFKARNLAGSSLKAYASGAAKCELEGAVDSFEGTASGAAAIKAGKLVAHKAVADVSGAGHLEINALDQLDATASGAGKIVYQGSPQVTKSISGVGAVRSASQKDSSVDRDGRDSNKGQPADRSEGESSDVSDTFISSLGIICAILIVFIIFGSPWLLVGFIFYIWFRYRAQKSGAPPAGVPMTGTPPQPVPVENSAAINSRIVRLDRRRGLVLVYVGVGIAIFLEALVGGSSWAWGAVPFFWGLALLHSVKNEESKARISQPVEPKKD